MNMRVRGQLYDLVDLDMPAYLHVINRIKIISDLTIYKHNIPQDGHIHFEDSAYTARVSFLPTNHGERIAIRLVTRYAKILNLDQVGMPSHMLETYKALLSRNQGMIVDRKSVV